MIRNYFKIAWRNLLRNKGYSFINLFGLAIGIACCMLILLWVTDELSYDQWNEKADRTYRVTPEVNFGGSHRHMAVSPAPVAEALRNDFPEIETAVRFRSYGSSLVKKDVQNFKEENIIYTDSTLFEVFSLEVTEGDPRKALTAPNSLVINESTAQKYFGQESALGKTLTFNDTQKYTVTGVIRDMPTNSHFNFDFFISLNGVPEAINGIWLSHNFFTYYVLKEGTDRDAFEEKAFPFMLEKYIAPQTQIMAGMSYEDLTKSGAFIKYHFQPLNDIHLHSDLDIEMSANSSIQYVRIFLAAALFILLIACVNFMNLSTAQSTMRAKEIGIRKVMGSLRRNLINQFLSESFLLVGIALILGLIFAQLALPSYNSLAEKHLFIPYGNPVFWGVLLIGASVVGLIAGSYPALYLSGFKPIQALSGRFLDKGGNINLRNALVVFQFLIAVVLIEGTIVIQRQMDFIQKKKLGFDRERVLVLQDAFALNNKINSFKDELLKNPEIKNVTASSFLPVPSSRSDSPLCKTAEIREDNCVSIQMWRIDEDYIPTLGIEMVKGRNFQENMLTDSNAVIINERAVEILGLEDPVGKVLYGSRNFDPQGGVLQESYTIIGIVEDFHFESLRQNIGALSFFLQPSSSYLAMKIQSDDPRSVISYSEGLWKEMAPGQPFAYQFLDESFDRIYQSEIRVGRIFSIFSGLSIFVACLGLLGLAAFATARRTKEIGIRKVLGATTAGIIGLLSKDFLRLVIIALVIASPLAWYFMKSWLQDFAYRIDIAWWKIFALSGVLAIIIAGITVSFQSIRAALTNPVKSLRSE